MRFDSIDALPEKYREQVMKKQGQVERDKPRKSKYGAVKTWVDGICFDSKKEAEKYNALKLLAKCGLIKGFLYHGKIILAEGLDKDSQALTYVPDFVVIKEDGTADIIDTKGMETPEFKIKMKTLKAKYPDLEVRTE